MNTSTLRTLTLRAGLAVAAAGSLSVVSCGPELAPEISNLQATATPSPTGTAIVMAISEETSVP